MSIEITAALDAFPRIQTERAIRDAASVGASGGASGDASTSEQAERVASKFGALLVEMMIDGMRKTLPQESAVARSGLQYEFFNDLLFQRYAESIADNDLLGLNNLISDALTR